MYSPSYKVVGDGIPWYRSRGWFYLLTFSVAVIDHLDQKQLREAYFILTLPRHSPFLERSQAGTEAETMEEHCDQLVSFIWNSGSPSLGSHMHRGRALLCQITTKIIPLRSVHRPVLQRPSPAGFSVPRQGWVRVNFGTRLASAACTSLNLSSTLQQLLI